jgi:hypothetical protein
MCNICSLTHQVHLHHDYFNSEGEGVVSTETSVSAKTTLCNNPEEDKVNTNCCEKLTFLILFFLLIMSHKHNARYKDPIMQGREQS